MGTPTPGGADEPVSWLVSGPLKWWDDDDDGRPLGTSSSLLLPTSDSSTLTPPGKINLNEFSYFLPYFILQQQLSWPNSN